MKRTVIAIIAVILAGAGCRSVSRQDYIEPGEGTAGGLRYYDRVSGKGADSEQDRSDSAEKSDESEKDAEN